MDALTRATVKQIDVTRAVKGAVAAGLLVARIEVDQRTGKIVIFSEGAESSAPNPWDEVIR
ncbi:hypothetical protein [Roseinatronobacter monicus]|uniref:hypothetical protein n=1 Tax=Roseinatronobacter monicus TaxID=393481 RepID=UPI003F2DB830